MKGKILVTGGAGYIGSHTIVDLIQNGYEVISIDNFSRSSVIALSGIKEITGQEVNNYDTDLTDFNATRNIFVKHQNIIGVIHFAAYKAVEESVFNPLLYYNNNLVTLINILKCIEEFKIPNFVFSSSCTVYGNPDEVCVTENTTQKTATSPYGVTKQMGEKIIQDFLINNTNTTAVLLRYFNPVGAHPSALIGELPLGKPMNLVPAITQTAIGKLPILQVNGNDYNTKDGSCIRDYVHVCDIANAHTLALNFLLDKKNDTNCQIFNLGTSCGISVLEAIYTFEKVTNQTLNYKIGQRRDGDVVAIYANNNLAVQKLGWQIKYNINDMMRTAWDWELHLNKLDK